MNSIKAVESRMGKEFIFSRRKYKKIGFEQISVRKNYYGNNEDAIIMMKII